LSDHEGKIYVIHTLHVRLSDERAEQIHLIEAIINLCNLQRSNNDTGFKYICELSARNKGGEKYGEKN